MFFRLDLFNRRFLTAVILSVLTGLFLIQAYFILSNSVNIPFMDEWDSHTAWDPHFSWYSVFLAHNEHRIVFTRALSWVLFRFGGAMWLQLLFNYLLYAIFLFFTLKVWKKFTRTKDALLPLFFLPFYLSPLLYENHFWGFQSQFHFYVLFTTLSVYFLFDETLQVYKVFLGAVFSTFACYSFSTGFVSSLSTLILFIFFVLYKCSTKQIPISVSVKTILIALIIIGVPLVYWGMTYLDHDNSPPQALPNSGVFWRYFLNLLSLGFGFQILSVTVGKICLFLVLAPTFVLSIQNRKQLTAEIWGYWALVLAFLAGLVIISIGRGAWFATVKNSRYAEVGIPLIYLTVIGWWLVLKNKNKYRIYFIYCLWLFCFTASLQNWNYSIYQEHAKTRLSGVNCLREQLNSEAVKCLDLYPGMLNRRLILARQFQTSFYRDLISP